MARYIKPDWFTRNMLNPTVRAFTRLGLSVWGSRILRVRGRKSGEWHNHPVNLLNYQGRQYLVSPRGHTQWVRNIRQSGEGELVLDVARSDSRRSRCQMTRRFRSCASTCGA